jgi:hypothetical protein
LMAPFFSAVTPRFHFQRYRPDRQLACHVSRHGVARTR